MLVALALQIPILMFMEQSMDNDTISIPRGRLRGLSAEAEFELPPADQETSFLEAESQATPEPEKLDELIEGTEKPVGQIVSIQPPEKEEIPDKAEFSARFASKVKEQIRARKPTENQQVPLKPTGKKQTAASREEQQGDRGSQDRSAPESAPSSASEGTAGEPGLPDSLFSKLSKRSGGPSISPGMGGDDPFDNVRSLGPRYASDDYLAGVDKEGDTNMLNTLPYRYIGFYERIREGVRKSWDPNRVYVKRDPRGEVYGYKDRMTVLAVELDKRGYLLETSIISSCGLRFLDEEAKRAMWAASPFLNPPEGLIGEDGRIRFNFSFVYLIAGSRNKMFWKVL